MRTIEAALITRTVRDLCIQANRRLPPDVERRIRECAEQEDSPVAREVFRHIIENAELAEPAGLALCQDTGLGLVFVEIGQDVRVTGGGLREAINEGVRLGYRDGFLRASANHPFTRVNTGDNTPAIIHFDIVPGDAVKIQLAAKGFGAENMSRALTIPPQPGGKESSARSCNSQPRPGPTPVLRRSSAWASGVPWISPYCWQKKPTSALWTT